MKKFSLTRRSFIKKTSVGLAGAALTVTGASSLYGNVFKNASALAIQGGTPVRNKPFPSSWPIFDETEEKALNAALRSGRWCCIGATQVADFEKEFAKAHNVPYCVATNGGTDALYTCLQVLDIAPGDEVITTPTTFIATVNIICNSHALPVFIDIDPETGHANNDLLESLITEHTKAIIPVHLGGYPEDIERIISIANKHNIPVVEDACQSLFAEVNNKKVGTFGILGCISFQETKCMSSGGEGGAIISSNEELMNRCGAFVNNGRDPKREKRGYPYPGSNFRMTELQGAVAKVQFERFKKQHEIRGKNGDYLTEKITQIPGIKKPKRIYPSTTRVTYYYPTLFDYNREELKNVPASKFAEAVRAEGIPIILGRSPDVSGKTRGAMGGGCNKEGMIEEHLKSRAFQVSFSKERLEKYRESLNLAVLDNYKGREILAIQGKNAFLGPKEDISDIIEAMTKVAKNIDKLA